MSHAHRRLLREAAKLERFASTLQKVLRRAAGHDGLYVRKKRVPR
jgi:hypothetical protein